MRILWGDCILTRGLTESVLFAPKPRAGQHTQPMPVAGEGSVYWRSGRKNHGKAQAHRFFRVTARGHSLFSAPAKKMIAETKTIIYAGRNTFTDEQGVFGRILMIHRFNIL